MEWIMDLFPRFQSRIKRILAPYPRIFIPVFRLFSSERKRLLLISSQTELVIEGFPRSGNTFAVVAFEFPQTRNVFIAHHLHVEAQVLEGVRRGIPVMVVIRDPLSAISSLVVRHPDIDPNEALKDYIRFYSAIEGLSEKVLMAEFNQITRDFGQVIQRFNDKFSTNFEIFQHSPENVEKVFKIIESINLKIDEGRETHVARPSDERKFLASQNGLQFNDKLLENANNAYIRLTSNGIN